MGYGDLGFTGHPSTRTPNLDRLASLGKRLTSWYSAYPVCSASRAALLTGRQPPRVGMPGVLNSLSAAGLPLNESTIADYLKRCDGGDGGGGDGGGGAAPYKTLAIGKWHQGQQPRYLPQARGFDRFYGLPFSVDDGEGYVTKCDSVAVSAKGSPLPLTAQTLPSSFTDTAGNDQGTRTSTRTRTSAGSGSGTGSGSGSGTGKGTAAAMAAAAEPQPQPSPLRLGPSLPLPLIRQDEQGSFIVAQPANLIPLASEWLNFTTRFVDDFAGKHPLFMYIAFGHVHTATPNINPQVGLRQYAGCQFQGTTSRGPFGDALAEVDWFTGKLVAHLEAKGMAEDTLILFTSDNGPSLRWGLGAGSVGPFQGSAAAF